MKRFFSRVKSGFMSSVRETFNTVTKHWRGCALLCLSTVGATTSLLSIGLSSAMSLTASCGLIWAISA